MADRDDWDGDEDEATILVRLIEHMADATHGTCRRCSRPIQASEPYEMDVDGIETTRAVLIDAGLSDTGVHLDEYRMHAPLCPLKSAPAVTP
jgi:hypothetical protein